MDFRATSPGSVGVSSGSERSSVGTGKEGSSVVLSSDEDSASVDALATASGGYAFAAAGSRGDARSTSPANSSTGSLSPSRRVAALPSIGGAGAAGVAPRINLAASASSIVNPAAMVARSAHEDLAPGRDLHRRSGSDTNLAAAEGRAAHHHHQNINHHHDGGRGHGNPSHITEQMRMDPAYYTYYYSQRPLDPRLPPPIVAPQTTNSVHHLFLAEKARLQAMVEAGHMDEADHDEALLEQVSRLGLDDPIEPVLTAGGGVGGSGGNNPLSRSAAAGLMHDPSVSVPGNVGMGRGGPMMDHYQGGRVGGFPGQADMLYMLQQQAMSHQESNMGGPGPMLDPNTIQMILMMQQQMQSQQQGGHQNFSRGRGDHGRGMAAGMHGGEFGFSGFQSGNGGVAGHGGSQVPDLWDYGMQGFEPNFHSGPDRDPFNNQDHRGGRHWNNRRHKRNDHFGGYPHANNAGGGRHNDAPYGGGFPPHNGGVQGLGGGAAGGGRGRGGHTSPFANAAAQMQQAAEHQQHQNRSPLLDEFRAWHSAQHMQGPYNNGGKRFDLPDIYGHVMEFAEDQHGSRFIQQKLETATGEEKQRVFDEIAPRTLDLVVDVFGNYVVQKFFEFGTPEQKRVLAENLAGHVVALSLQMYGCRVIQKALESLEPDEAQELIKELDGNIMKCVKDQNGNHVIQKVIERVRSPPESVDFVVNSFLGSVYALATHPYGCRVIQRILENCTEAQQRPILDELMRCTIALVQDQYGNYVIQHVFAHKHAGNVRYKSEVLKRIKGQIVSLSQHKFASNVIEKCVEHGSPEDRQTILKEVLEGSDGDAHNLQTALWAMMKDQYANYVIQKMIDTLDEEHRQLLITHIRPHMMALRRFPYGKHILGLVDRFLNLSMPTSDLPPQPRPRKNRERERGMNGDYSDVSSPPRAVRYDPQSPFPSDAPHPGRGSNRGHHMGDLHATTLYNPRGYTPS